MFFGFYFVFLFTVFLLVDSRLLFHVSSDALHSAEAQTITTMWSCEASELELPAEEGGYGGGGWFPCRPAERGLPVRFTGVSSAEISPLKLR